MARPDAAFTVESRDGRWRFVTPDGRPMFSIGMNHIDPAALRYPEGEDLFAQRYGNSMERWLRERVAPDLRAWGFNTVGWAQEVVTRGRTQHRHSRSFTPQEYRWLGMPYCHMLPFAEVHQWDVEVPYPDVFTPEFEQWCDHVARTDCAALADDPNLVGYFYSDCPAWTHCPAWNRKGPWFDAESVRTDAGRRALAETARRYYQVAHDAVRRYDPRHLILGDRYEAKVPLPEEVLDAALPTVDVLSFQYFDGPEAVCRDFARWHEQTGKPILLADASVPEHEPALYGEMIRALRELNCCVGWHVCGAYLTNRCRRHGFRDERDEPVEAMVAAATAANRETNEWIAATLGRMGRARTRHTA